MSIFVDCHVHLYPGYDLAELYASAWSNARRAVQHARGATQELTQVALLLSERSGQEEFRRLVSSPPVLPGMGVHISSDGSALVLTSTSQPRSPLFLFAGRQLVAKEGIEVLSLIGNVEIDEDLPAADLIDAIVSSGGVPCLPWSPGKWLFGRGAVVKNLCSRHRSVLTLGDIPMRPCGLPALGPANKWSKGVPLLAGTDVLPLPRENLAIGSFGTWYRSTIDEQAPAPALRLLLRQPGSLMGNRNSFKRALTRWLRLRKASKRARTALPNTQI